MLPTEKFITSEKEIMDIVDDSLLSDRSFSMQEVEDNIREEIQVRLHSLALTKGGT